MTLKRYRTQYLFTTTDLLMAATGAKLAFDGQHRG